MAAVGLSPPGAAVEIAGTCATFLLPLSAACERVVAALEVDTLQTLVVVALACLGAAWLSLRLTKTVLSYLVRGVLRDVLADDQIGEGFAVRFVQAMRRLNRDKEFRGSIGEVMWGDTCAEMFQTAGVGLLQDARFTEAVAEVIRGLTCENTLKEAVKKEIRDTLKDQHIHRAMIQGSLRALQPAWLVGSDSRPQSPEPTDNTEELFGGGCLGAPARGQDNNKGKAAGRDRLQDRRLTHRST